MTSSGPYTQAYDMKHMYDLVDLRTKQKRCFLPTKNNMLSVINTNQDFKIFSTIVEKAQHSSQLSQPQADFTLFVPSDAKIRQRYSQQFIDNIDAGMAKRILLASMMNRKIDQFLIQSSPVCTFPTMDRSNSLFVHTIDGITTLPNNTTVIHWNHFADNGLIHVIDNFLIPLEVF